MEGSRPSNKIKLYNHFKKNISDFIVEEKISLDKRGEYPLYLLKKSNVSTLEAVRILSRFLKIHPADIGFAGLKDKYGITSQYLTFPKGDYPKNICFVQKNGKWLKTNKTNYEKGTGFCIEKKGSYKKKLEVGELEGNFFTVTLKNLSKEQRKLIFKNADFIKEYGFANYFGEQRFGTLKGFKQFLLPYLLKGDYWKAIEVYLRIKGYKGPLKNWEEVYRILKGKLEIYERDFILGLKRGLKPEKAFRILPKNIRLMFNFSFQSYLWNRYLYLYIKNKYSHKIVNFINNWKLAFYIQVQDFDYLKNLEIPYTGKEFSVEDKLLKEIIQKVLKETEIKEEFFEKEIIGIKVLTDGKRRVVVIPKDLAVKKKGSDLILSFFLPSGSYATILLRALLS